MRKKFQSEAALIRSIQDALISPIKVCKLGLQFRFRSEFCFGFFYCFFAFSFTYFRSEICSIDIQCHVLIDLFLLFFLSFFSVFFSSHSFRLFSEIKKNSVKELVAHS